MASILVVDDEVSYCEELERALTSAGHSVRTATDGASAIEIGSRYRPDLLLADWMLSEGINGLHVVEALRIVHPDLRVIILSGYVSADLQFEADNQKIFEVLEKPFSLGQLRAAVKNGLRSNVPNFMSDLPIGVVEVRPDGTLLFSNPYALELFEGAFPGREISSLKEIFSERTLALLAESERGWLQVSPESNSEIKWFLRIGARSDGTEKLCVILEEDQARYQTLPAVQLLLGLESGSKRVWPSNEHVLIVDSDRESRKSTASALEAAGCSFSHSAESEEEGLRLLERDPDVHLVVVGSRDQGEQTNMLRRMKQVRPKVSVVDRGS